MSEEKEVSFNEQGFLIWDHYIKGRDSKRVSKIGEGLSSNTGVTLHKVIGKYTNVNFVSKMMKKENIDIYKHLVDLETRKLTSLIPDIRLYKIVDNKYIPFYFPVSSEKATMQTLLSPGASLGGAGIRNFSVKFVGKDFFTRDKMIECSLSIFLDSVENVFREPPAGYAVLADLFTISRAGSSMLRSGQNKKVQSDLVNRPTSHEIAAYLGYNYDSKSDILTDREKRAIDSTKMSLRMTYTGHDINVQQNGSATINVTFIGRFSGILDDPLYNVMASPQSIDILSQIRKQETNKNVGTKAESNKDREERLKNQKKVNTRTMFRQAFEVLEKEEKIHSKTIKLEDLYKYNLYVGRQQDPSLGRRLKNGTKNEAPSDEADTGLASDDPEDIKNLASSKTIPNTNNLVTRYVYMGDLIQAVIFNIKFNLEMQIIRIQNRVNGPAKLNENLARQQIKPLQESLDNLKTFKILFGKIAISIGETSSIYVNIADIPISMKTVATYAFNHLEQNYRTKLTLRKFLDDVIYHLYPMATTKHLYRDAKSLPDKMEIKSTVLTGENEKSLTKAKKEVNIKDLPDFLRSLTPGKKTDDDAEYFIFYSEPPSDKGSGLSGNEKKDAEDGIYHFHLSKDRGMVKSINFSLNNVKYRKEALMLESVDLYDELRMPYNANITMYGNNLFLPGSVVYVNPASIGFGDPRNRRSAAARLGLGGYYVITSVETSFDGTVLNTTLEAQYHSWADEDSAASTAEMLQNTGIFEKAKRIVERNTGKKSPVQRIF